MPDDKEHLITTDISNISDKDICYGYWRAYLFNEVTEEYEPIYNEFIFYKGKFFDNLDSKPWDNESYQKVRMLSSYFNKDGEPICIFRHERSL